MNGVQNKWQIKWFKGENAQQKRKNYGNGMIKVERFYWLWERAQQNRKRTVSCFEFLSFSFTDTHRTMPSRCIHRNAAQIVRYLLLRFGQFGPRAKRQNSTENSSITLQFSVCHLSEKSKSISGKAHFLKFVFLFFAFSLFKIRNCTKWRNKRTKAKKHFVSITFPSKGIMHVVCRMEIVTRQPYPCNGERNGTHNIKWFSRFDSNVMNFRPNDVQTTTKIRKINQIF